MVKGKQDLNIWPLFTQYKVRKYEDFIVGLEDGLLLKRNRKGDKEWICQKICVKTKVLCIVLWLTCFHCIGSTVLLVFIMFIKACCWVSAEDLYYNTVARQCHLFTLIPIGKCWWCFHKIASGENHIDHDGLVQDCSNSIGNALELLQSCTKPLIYL